MTDRSTRNRQCNVRISGARSRMMLRAMPYMVILYEGGLTIALLLDTQHLSQGLRVLLMVEDGLPRFHARVSSLDINDLQTKRAVRLYEHPKITCDQQLYITITPPQ